jgi:16S rRNA A1518/A1519 N6-dimethyltransferase RsmA/KsgA/DIM1 with predicted DNA glycosylase/AP lyase activity
MVRTISKVWLLGRYKGIKSMDKNSEIIDKVVETYFEEPDKTLKAIFKEYTEGFSEDETKAFYEKLKEIVN